MKGPDLEDNPHFKTHSPKKWTKLPKNMRSKGKGLMSIFHFFQIMKMTICKIQSIPQWCRIRTDNNIEIPIWQGILKRPWFSISRPNFKIAKGGFQIFRKSIIIIWVSKMALEIWKMRSWRRKIKSWNWQWKKWKKSMLMKYRKWEGKLRNSSRPRRMKQLPSWLRNSRPELRSWWAKISTWKISWKNERVKSVKWFWEKKCWILYKINREVLWFQISTSQWDIQPSLWHPHRWIRY